jgi:hypothetical protein
VHDMALMQVLSKHFIFLVLVITPPVLLT